MAIRLVAIDVSLAYPPDWREAFGTIHELAVYDDQEATHCCELTPMRLLVTVGLECAKGYEEGTAELAALGLDSMPDVEWRDDRGEPYYMHCSVADRLPFLTYETEATGEEAVEEAREHYTGNVPSVAEIMKARGENGKA